MADLKISQLTSATLPLAGTEVLPIVQSGSTKKVATDDLTVKNLRSSATTGILQVAGPAASSTRVMTVPDANFSVARTDAANSFAGTQTVSTGGLVISTFGQQLLLGGGAQAGCVTANRSNNLPNNGTMTISVPWASTYPLSYLVVAGQIRTADGRFETNQVDFLNSFGTFTNITTQQGSLAAWSFTLSFSAGVITFKNTGGGDANASIAVFGIGRLF